MSHNPKKAIKQLTLRGFEPELEKRIRELAQRDDISLNKAALALLRRGAGIAKEKQPDRVGDGLDAFIGKWTNEEADQFDRFIEKEFEKIDPEFWE